MAGISSRTAVAVHILAYLAWRRGEPATSERIAGSVNTNPVVVRRLMGALRDGGLVTAQPGVGGGATLARSADAVSLLDVYRAVEDADLFALHPQPPCRHCDVGGNIQAVLGDALGAAQRAMERALAGVTIADVVECVAVRVRDCCAEATAAGASAAAKPADGGCGGTAGAG
jgi:Rrf2 family protein